LHEARAAFLRQQSRERRLAGARRTPKDERGQRAFALNDAPQKAALADQLSLSDELVERARAHPLGERRTLVRRRDIFLRFVEKTFTTPTGHTRNSPGSSDSKCRGAKPS
jgi:hypothetical protein